MDSLPMHAWHPMFVHFPLGLLLGGVAVDLAGWLSRRPALRRAGLILLSAGVLLALPAIATGLLAYGRVDHSDAAHALMKLHRNLMLAAVSLFGAAVVWRWRLGERAAAGALYGLLLALATAALVVGADRGSYLVYGHATGLPSPRLEEVLHDRRTEHGHRADTPPLQVQPRGAGEAGPAGPPPAAASADSSDRGHDDGAAPPHTH